MKFVSLSIPEAALRACGPVHESIISSDGGKSAGWRTLQSAVLKGAAFSPLLRTSQRPGAAFLHFH
jgi:hypothetical protein